jgi:branched-chain amino acid transport system ATP-binding protein
MLSAEGIHAGYDEIQVLDDVSLEVERGDIVSVIGPNGAGKTTLMRVLAGLLSPTRGTVHYDGSDVTGIDPPDRIQAGLALVPEERNLFRSMTVRENLVLGSYTARGRKAERLEYVYDLFPKLEARRDQRAGTLSGGEAQMLSLGRSLMTAPELLLLDEPSLGLAPKLIPDLFEAIREVNRDGVSILIVEQEMERALEIADFGYILEKGAIAARDRASTLAEDPEVVRKYLGMR